MDSTRRRTRVNATSGRLASVALLLIMTASATGATPPDPQALLTQYKCYICHADRESKAGPAYVEVAARFRDNPNAVSVIALEIRRGLRRGGPWHMPPHPEVSAAEARAMARYIMSIRP